MSEKSFALNMNELRKLLASVSTIKSTADGEQMKEEACKYDSPWGSIFSKAAYSPPMLSAEERENLQLLTNRAAESLTSRNPLMENGIVNIIAPQLACLLAMPVPSDQPETVVTPESSKSPLDRYKSGDSSLALREIIGDVQRFSFDHEGSRFLQEKLEAATNEERDAIFQEILPIAKNLMMDMFGNYVIQKYFDYGSLEQIRELANVILGNVVKLALHKHGCRVLQTALEVVDMDKRVSFAKEIDGHVIRCSCDQYGSHVVAKIIECVPEELIGFLISFLANKIALLSAHQYANQVIQILLECCDEESDRLEMLSNILKDVHNLSHDQYGNYVIQKPDQQISIGMPAYIKNLHILEKGRPQERSAVIRTLSGKVLEMSRNKFATNVIDKGLRFGGPQDKQLIVDEILTLANGRDNLQMMVKNLHGNYLVHTALEVSTTEQLADMISRINHYAIIAKRYKYEPQIISMIEKLIQKGEKIVNLRISKASQKEIMRL